jgi:hypothetical protein
MEITREKINALKKEEPEAMQHGNLLDGPRGSKVQLYSFKLELAKLIS